MVILFSANSAKIYVCNFCDVKCIRKNDWDRHILTQKHVGNVSGNKKSARTIFECEICNKIYNSQKGLWGHRKKCGGINKTSGQITEKNNPVIDFLMKENAEFKNIIIEFIKTNKEFIEVCKNNSTNTIINSNNGVATIGNNNVINTTNNTFNLQVFLNEQCKDAMNIGEFVDSFDIQLDELENVGNVGYVDGISRIITNRLKAMDVYKRPFHCSDLKRETMYVKDQNKWEKEEKSNPKLRKAIRAVTQKNMVKVGAWRDANPDCRSNKSHLNDQFIKIVRQASGGIAEITDSEDKIMRRLAKEVGIDKT